MASKHNVKLLIYFEVLETMESAIRREKNIKDRNRNWKIRQIEERNPGWWDLFEDICG